MDTPPLTPGETGTDWIDELTDSQCMEVFWLYVDPPEPFLAKFPPALLGAAMRHALRQVAAGAHGVGRSPAPDAGGRR